MAGWNSPKNWGLNGKNIYKLGVFNCHVWLPEGTPVTYSTHKMFLIIVANPLLLIDWAMFKTNCHFTIVFGSGQYFQLMDDDRKIQPRPKKTSSFINNITIHRNIYWFKGIYMIVSPPCNPLQSSTNRCIVDNINWWSSMCFSILINPLK